MQRKTKNLKHAECVQAIVFHEEGWSYRRIGDIFGVPHTSVSHMVEQFRKTGEHRRTAEMGEIASRSQSKSVF